MIDDMIQKTDQYDILIVDDTPDSLRLLNRILEERGFRVRAATNDCQALKSVEASLAEVRELADSKQNNDIDQFRLGRRK